ncbi:hypothetical protein ACA910_017614 [Epithemia clementina (nom. ined.)]
MTSGSDDHTPNNNAALAENLIAPVLLPPLSPHVAPTGQEPTVPVLLPPLPLPIGNTVQERPHLHPHAVGAIGPGQFVPGDSTDCGVKLLAKLQHGVCMVGPGTKSRRASTKVLCIAVCPMGGHFTTGAAVGICHVYSTDDDKAIGLADFDTTVRAGFLSAKGHKRRNGPSCLWLLDLPTLRPRSGPGFCQQKVKSKETDHRACCYWIGRLPGHGQG